MTNQVKWVAEIPKPSAKRLLLISVYLIAGSNWSGFCKHELTATDGLVVFELDPDYNPIDETDAMDDTVFYVEAEFKNSTGSRTEVLRMKAVRF